VDLSPEALANVKLQFEKAELQPEAEALYLSVLTAEQAWHMARHCVDTGKGRQAGGYGSLVSSRGRRLVESVRFTRLDVRVRPTTIEQVMKRLCTVFAFAIVLTGCATQSQLRHPTRDRQTSDGTVVDYDGVPCRNQNMHVKSPICLFPTTLLASHGRI
jgi:hypothetical protein